MPKQIVDIPSGASPGGTGRCYTMEKMLQQKGKPAADPPVRRAAISPNAGAASAKTAGPPRRRAPDCARRQDLPRRAQVLRALVRRRPNLPSRILVAITLAALFFLTSNGLAWCAGCPGKKMECCRAGDASTRLSTKSCCSSQVGSLPETPLSILDRGAPADPLSRAALLAGSTRPADPITCVDPPELQPPPPRIGTPPLFILNAALLR